MIIINIFIFKAKHLALIACILTVILTAIFSSTALPVFNTGKRELPIYSVAREDNKASVTFNCAWNDDDIASILSTLDKYNIKATFFIVGDWAEKHPEALKQIFDNGHEIGAHSYNHKDYTKLSAEEITKDITICDEAIKAVTGHAPVLYRVPSGAYNNTAIKTLEKNKKVCIQWSHDTIDYDDASAEEIYSRSIKLETGGILLMHNGTKNTALALPRVLDNLTGRFNLVKVSELIYSDNFRVDANGCMHSLENGE